MTGQFFSEKVKLSPDVHYYYNYAQPLPHVNGVSYTWDGNGNLLSDGVNTYTYDHANRLTAASGPSSAVSFGYNGLGDRLQQVFGGVTTHFVLDLNNSLSQVLSDGSNTYLYGLERTAQQNVVGRQYYFGDALGSVRQLTNAVGSVTLARSYEPFGKPLSSAGNPLAEYSFTGELQDPTGLIFLRARYYDPTIGRFLSKDPVRGIAILPQTLNPFTYAINNPVRYTDPSGEFPFLLFIAGGLLGGAIYGYGSQVINNLNHGMCLGDALYTNIDWLSFWMYTGVGGLIGGGIGGVAFGAGQVAEAAMVACIASPGSSSFLLGIQSFNSMPPEAGYQRHHLLDVRFARMLGINPNIVPSIYLTPPEHQIFYKFIETSN